MRGPDDQTERSAAAVGRVAPLLMLVVLVTVTASEPVVGPPATSGVAMADDRPDLSDDQSHLDPAAGSGDHVLGQTTSATLRRLLFRPPFLPSDSSGQGDGPAPDQMTDPGTEPVGERAGWRLVWSDEFEGGGLDTSVWRAYHSTYGDGNRELQCHTPDNVAVSDGRLQLTARREQVSCPGGVIRQFSSGFVGTREAGVYFPRFARYEMRARIPHGQGLWPAFWLRHRDGSTVAEVDVMEYFHAQVPGRTSMTLHLDGQVNVSKGTVFVEEPTSPGGWHVWAVEIEEVAEGVEFQFSFNDEVVHTYVDTRAQWASRHPGQPLFDIAVNLSVGGEWAGHPDDPLGYLGLLERCAKGQDPGPAPHACDAEGVVRASFPAVYEVDYVRVYERERS